MAEIQSHIHLDSVNPPIAEYPVVMGSLDNTPLVAVTTERSLTGKLHAHHLDDGAGGTVQFCADKFRLILTLAQKITVCALAGSTIFYIPNYHTEAAPAAEIIEGILLLAPGGTTNLDPMGDWWYVTCAITDDEQIP